MGFKNLLVNQLIDLITGEFRRAKLLFFCEKLNFLAVNLH